MFSLGVLAHTAKDRTYYRIKNNISVLVIFRLVL